MSRHCIAESGYDATAGYLAECCSTRLVGEMVLFQRREAGMSQGS